MQTTAPITPTASGHPSVADQLADVLPVVDTVYVAGPPGDGSRLFVVERAGRVQLLVNGQ